MAASETPPALEPGRAASRAVVDAVPAVESRFAAVVVVPAVRVAVVGVLVVAVAPGRAAPTELLVAPTVEVAGRRVVAVVAGFPGLEAKVLVLLEAVEETDFFSSSLALTLGLLRCVAVVEDDVGRRTVLVVDVGGRVGGLLSPPVVRVAAVGALAVDVVVVPGRRAEVADAAVAVREVAVDLAAEGDTGVVALAVRGVEGEAAGAAPLSAMLIVKIQRLS